jgi:LmbE family N-acetylglucosaminyl deacetylase
VVKKWVYLSPHFDDAVLSVGGLVWQQSQQGDDVEVWTICAGNPPVDIPLSPFAKSLHAIWKIGDDVPFIRNQEDLAACQLLGVHPRHLAVPDCIYRTLPGNPHVLVDNEEDLYKFSPDENYLIDQIGEFLQKNIQPDSDVVAPLGIGCHRDHTLTCMAAKSLKQPLWHYADYPYIIKNNADLASWIHPHALKLKMILSPQGLKAWQDGVACHHSQIALFWKNDNEMRAAIQNYSNRIHQELDDVFLWKF